MFGTNLSYYWGKNHLPSSPYTTVIGIQLQLTLEQHGFELFWSTHMWITNKYVHFYTIWDWLNPQIQICEYWEPCKRIIHGFSTWGEYPKPLYCSKVNYNQTCEILAPKHDYKDRWFPPVCLEQISEQNEINSPVGCISCYFQGWKHVLFSKSSMKGSCMYTKH